MTKYLGAMTLVKLYVFTFVVTGNIPIIHVPSELQCLATLPARVCGCSSDKYSGVLILEVGLMYVTS